MTALSLAEFLLARIAEDEEWATEAAHWGSASWSPNDLGRWDVGGELQPVTGAEAMHVSRHDPSRVWAECEAKRRVVRLLAECERGGCDGATAYMRDAVAWLASPYSGHPEFRDEWRA